MLKKMTEDEVRDKARGILNMENKSGVKSGFGQITSFNQLGFQGVNDKPDGWYLPENVKEVAVVVELKASGIALEDKQVDELLKNVRIVQKRYGKVVGVQK